MNEPFNQHLTANAETWHELAKRGFVKTEDLVKARNYDNKYSYAEQTKALKNINDSLSQTIKRNPDNEQLIKFVSGVTDATDEMIRDKVKSSFRDLDKITESDIRMKANKLGIPYEEFKENVDKVKTEVETEKGRARRAKEINDMAWYNPQKWATSDYEKQRYINDPDASIIGKEGNSPYWNKGEAISDLAYGVAGAAGDALPGWGSTVGPAIRGMRDVSHKLNDSKYQKDWDEIAVDMGKDALFNVLIEKTPTAQLRKSDKNIARAGQYDKYMKRVQDYRNVVHDVQANRAGVDALGGGKIYNMSDNEIIKAIDDMPDGTMKKILQGHVKDGEVPRGAIGETLATFDALSNPKNLSPKHAVYDDLGNIKQSKKDYFTNEGNNAWDYVRDQARVGEYSKAVRAGAKVADAVQEYGGAVLKEANTVRGRGVKPKTSDREDIDWFKENYARDWAAGFAPRGKEDEPIMKAYREWQEENKQTKPKFRDIMRGE